eukprot:6724558-Alexandrium_andersonii.AAC.1
MTRQSERRLRSEGTEWASLDARPASAPTQITMDGGSRRSRRAAAGASPRASAPMERRRGRTATR